MYPQIKNQLFMSRLSKVYHITDIRTGATKSVRMPLPVW